jgi:hypothetical protein
MSDVTRHHLLLPSWHTFRQLEPILCMLVPRLQVPAQVLADLQQGDPQAHINGCSNTWIVKPAGKSRGRGIRLFSIASQLLEYVGQVSTLLPVAIAAVIQLLLLLQETSLSAVLSLQGLFECKSHGAEVPCSTTTCAAWNH